MRRYVRAVLVAILLAASMALGATGAPQLEHAEDVRVSTLRDYLEALGARHELVAVLEDEGRRVPVHLGKESAA